MKAKSFSWLPILLSYLLLAGSSRMAAAADVTPNQNLRKIAIAYSGISPGQSPIWVTHEADSTPAWLST